MTTTQTTSEPTVPEVVREVEVPLDPDRAFALFTEQMTAFWPAEHSIGEAAFVAVVVEPEEGGRWFERDAEGRECRWGSVRVWEPPRRLGLIWSIDARWTYDPDLVTHVDVTFEPAGSGTRVRLHHHGLEAYGDQAHELAALYAEAGGWAGTLEAFSRAAADA